MTRGSRAPVHPEIPSTSSMTKSAGVQASAGRLRGLGACLLVGFLITACISFDPAFDPALDPALEPAFAPAFHDGVTFTQAGVAFGVREIRSHPFVHFALEPRTCRPEPQGRILVYLDGDGNSWVSDGRVSADPTPRHPLALELLAADGYCGLYLARPCTFGAAQSDPACGPGTWTVERYSERVLVSLQRAIRLAVPEDVRIVLVGYSGGGLLAAHLAQRMPEVDALVTLGANLDLDAWIRHHGYTEALARATPRLPARLRPELEQHHVLGARDDVSPAEFTKAWARRQSKVNLIVLEEADHRCCWVEAWRGIREAISSTR